MTVPYPALCLDEITDAFQFEEGLPLQDAWFEFQQRGGKQLFAGQLYRGSLQLLAAENDAGTLSIPQILFPALRGLARK